MVKGIAWQPNSALLQRNKVEIKLELCCGFSAERYNFTQLVFSFVFGLCCLGYLLLVLTCLVVKFSSNPEGYKKNLFTVKISIVQS
jgi:hypothetical protein